jgi:hypothetical protein
MAHIWGQTHNVDTGYPGHHHTKHRWLSLADELRLIRQGLPFLTSSQQEQILGGTAAELWELW